MEHKNLNTEEAANSDLGAVMRWVAVEDRLPKKNTYGMLGVRNYHDLEKGLTSETISVSFFDGKFHPHNEQITHWMEYPKPP